MTFHLISRKKGWSLKLETKIAVKTFFHSNLLRNILLYVIEANMVIFFSYDPCKKKFSYDPCKIKTFSCVS